MKAQERYDTAIKHIKNSGLLTDLLYCTQVHNAIHIAAFGVKGEYIPGKRDKPGLDTFD